jgi:HAD superfamily hydrolase (TIGR01509 family)
LISAIIFDCDGTLVDSETIGITAVHEHAQPYGLSLALDDILEKFRGRSMAENVAELGRNTQHPLPESFTASAREAMGVAFSKALLPLPGALDLVRQLTLPCCVATNGPFDKTEYTLGLTGLLPYFKGRIFSAYDVGYWKPDPHLFLHAAKTLGVVPTECAVVEDSLPGIRAGLAAGMQVFSLHPVEHTPPELLRQIHPIQRLADLAPVLGLKAF